MKFQTHPLRILVADDSPAESALLHAELRSVSWLTLVGFVRNGVEAIDYLQGVEKFKERELFPYPDLLLLDFNMPKCNGMGVLGFLHRQFCRPRVIMWSNTLERVDVPLALRLGADMVCHKPASKSELLELIQGVEAKVSGIGPLSTYTEPPNAFCPHS